MSASLLIVAPAAISATPAAAVDDDPTVEVTIDSFGPVAPRPGQTVTIKGTVKNTSTTTFGNPQAITCIDRDRLTTAAQVAAVPNEQNIPMNDRNSCSGIDTPDTPTFQVLGEKLAPNAKVAFTLTVPWEEWRISRDTGVYTVGVTFRGDPQESSRVTAGRARTLMPVIGTQPLPSKVNTALVIPLRHRPTFLGGNLFADDSLALAMGKGGSLRRLLDLGKQRRVTWLIDPAVVEAARTMTAAAGYRIGSGKNAVAGTNGKVARAWLDDFAASQTAGNQVIALPFGDPDVASLVDAGGSLKELVRQARMTSEQFPLGPIRTNGLWLENSAAASRYLAFASSGFAGARESDDLTLVNSGAWSADAAAKALTPGTAFYQVLTPEGPNKQARTVVANSALTAGGPDLGSNDDPVQVRQRFIAETALLAASGKGPAATVVALPPRGWDADGRSTAVLADALTQPWLEQVTVDQVVKATPKPRAISAPNPPKAEGSLGAAQVTAVKQLERSIRTYQALLADPGDVTPDMRQGLLQSTSLGWVGFPSEAGRYLAVEQASVSTQLGEVHLVNSSLDQGKGIKVNLAGSKGTFPLTVANDLDHSIRVGVVVRSVNRTDLRVGTVDTVVVRAGQKWTPRINASAEQNGVIQATAQVVTVNGEPVGKAQPMVIQASQYGSVGWILVGAACALLFGTSFVRIYRRIRRERRNPPTDDAAAEATADVETAPEPDPLHPAPLPAAPGTSTSLKEGVGSKDG